MAVSRRDATLFVFGGYMVEVKLRGGTESAQAASIAVADHLAFCSASSSSSILFCASTSNHHEISNPSTYDHGPECQRAKVQLSSIAGPEGVLSLT